VLHSTSLAGSLPWRQRSGTVFRPSEQKVILEIRNPAADGRYFEDFAVGEHLDLPNPRTLSAGETAVYLSLTGDRTPNYCGPEARLHPLIVFHTVFGQTVRAISLNAVANLGYARGLWGAPVYAGDTLRTSVDIIGLKENRSGGAGIVYLDTVARNQNGAEVLRYTRWVMVKKRSPSPTIYLDAPVIPALPVAVGADALDIPRELSPRFLDTGHRLKFDDYGVGDVVPHYDGMQVNAADHMSFTRLFQNSARLHFDGSLAPGGTPLVYGGVVMSIGYAMSHAGFEGRYGIRAINGGSHANPTHAGDTLYAFTEVVEAQRLGRDGALRLRLVVVKNRAPWRDGDYALYQEEHAVEGRSRYRGDVVLDFDYWDVVPV
jgi:2-methylfumaryl-CoA hydratase